MNCTLCENDQFTPVADTDCKSGKALHIVLCNQCGLIQQSPIPSESELRDYYATEYRMDYKKTLVPKSKHIHRSARLAIQRLEQLRAAGITSGDLLDIGAGSGEFVTVCARSGFSAEGAEPNVGYSDYARSEYGARVHTSELNDITGTYDVVTMFHVMEHLRSPGQAFAKLHSLLKPGGHLLIEVPWAVSPAISPSNRYFKAHLHYFDLETLVSFASGCFDVIAAKREGNLSVMLRRSETLRTRVLPSPDYADEVRASVSRFGWWNYLTEGGACRVPARKIRHWLAERKVRDLRGTTIVENQLRERSTSAGLVTASAHHRSISKA